MIVVSMLIVTRATAQIDTCGTCDFPCKRTPEEVFTLRLTGGRPDPVRTYMLVRACCAARPSSVWKG